MIPLAGDMTADDHVVNGMLLRLLRSSVGQMPLRWIMRSMFNERGSVKATNKQARRAKAPTKEQQLEVGLLAFFNVAARWELTIAEQCALLAVSPSTRARWKVKPPAVSEALLHRLRLAILTYRRLVELTGGTDAETARVLRQAGSAENPKRPRQSLLGGLSTRSLPEMDRCYRRLEGLIHAS